MKLLRPILMYVAGFFSAVLLWYLSPTYDAAIVYQRNVGLFVKAHMLCFEDVIATWAQADSTYIPLDSLEKVYLETCGDYIEKQMR